MRNPVGFMLIPIRLLSCWLLAASSSAPLLRAQVEDPIPEPIDRSNIVVELELFVQIPPSSIQPPRARINHLKPAHDGSGRRFVNDLNGKLHIVSEGSSSVYLDLAAWVSDLAVSPGLGTGFTSFSFHPEFSSNGKLYTAHMAPSASAPADFSPPNVASPIDLQGVVLEWTATEPQANSFAGAFREILRIDLVGTIHGIQEIAFNPTATAESDDYGLLYICVGDSGTTIDGFPENTSRLDSVLGTILRIDPLGNNSVNGQYGIPVGNPWAADGDANTLGEIYAYGFRNPHRISWDEGGSGLMLSGDIGERNIEELNLIESGRHYGWNQREGTFVINPEFADNPSQGARDEVFPLPDNDDSLGFTYPVAQYDHDEGFAIVSGYVYRGAAGQLLQGLHIFGDIKNGRVFAVDAASLSLGSQATIQELNLEFEGELVTMLDLMGTDRADLRFGYDEANDLYLLEKQQGNIYKIAGARTLSGGGGGQVTSGWQLIDDFEDGDASDWSVSLDAQDTVQENGSLAVIDDPFDSGQGKVLAVDPGVSGEGTHHVTAWLGLPEGMQVTDPFPETRLSTLYFKVGRPTVGGAPGELDITWGLTTSATLSGPDDVYSYGDYSVLGRYEADGIMDIRNGGSYVDLASEALDTNVYYEIWFVIDHSLNRFTQYLRGGSDFPEQTKVFENAAYRNATFQNLDTLLLITSAGNTIDGAKGKDPAYFDSFHIDVSGENLTSPTKMAQDTRFINISTRAEVKTGDSIVIGGFVLRGEGPQRVLIRAVGPTLAAEPFNLAGTLADPVIRLFKSTDPGAPLATADDWGEEANADEIEATAAAVGAFALLEGSTDAVMLLELERGAYTVQVSGKDGGTGIALMEVYEVD